MFAKVYFLIQFNRIESVFKTYIPTLNESDSKQLSVETIEGLIYEAEKTMLPGRWKEGYTFQPSDAHLAKLRHRQAYYLRLAAENHLPESVMALQYIEQALAFRPGDPMILNERRIILDWVNIDRL